MIITGETPSHRIDRRIYGQFAEHLGRCIYEGIWVGEDSTSRTTTASATTSSRRSRDQGARGALAGRMLRRRVPLADGVGPERAADVNTHWGGVVETNTFGTHEFFELCTSSTPRRTSAATSAAARSPRCGTGSST